MGNIHIEESSMMGRGDFLSALHHAKHDVEYINVRAHRTTKSLLREWAAHKLLFRLGLFKSHTISVDLNYPQKWYVRAMYFVAGSLALPLYK